MKDIIDIAKSNSVCGTPFMQDGFTFIPINEVSASYTNGNKGNKSLTLSPKSFLVIKDGKVKTVSVKTESDSTEVLIDLLLTTVKKIFKKQID